MFLLIGSPRESCLLSLDTHSKRTLLPYSGDAWGPQRKALLPLGLLSESELLLRAYATDASCSTGEAPAISGGLRRLGKP